jgi:lysylphosphatidylglycerol synthetase-like protein (DUF2156 family)
MTPREIALRYGHGALWPFQIAPQLRLFGDGAHVGTLAYGEALRASVMLGDPIGLDTNAWAVFDAFLADCERRGRTPAVYQASAEGVARLHERGFSSLRIGQEAVLETLAGFNTKGSRRANLRHTITRAGKGGLSVTWHPEGLTHEEIETHWEGLDAIDRVWRRRAGPALGFTIGRFSRAALGDRPISIAWGEGGKPVAFATFLPTGNDNGWVLDLMRRLPGSVPGALEWCVAEAATQLGLSGERRLSLSLAPLGGIGGADAGRPERVLATTARMLRPVYDVRGLQFFKDKFDVRWEPRYLAVRRMRDLPQVGAALLALHLRPPKDADAATGPAAADPGAAEPAAAEPAAAEPAAADPAAAASQPGKTPT